MTDRPSPDIVERLRSHAPSMGYGGCQDCYDLVMEDAADEIERLRAQIQPATPTAGEPVMWCGWHPEHGYAAQTCGHNEQHASSLLMRTDIAGNHGWSVVPLYPATGGDAVAGDGEAATAPQSIETLLSAWRMDARQLEEAAEQEDISDEEHTLNKYIAKQIRDCIEQLERAQWDVSAATGRKSLADWSGLPRDLYVTEVKSDDGIVFDVHCCSVPMAIGPEVRYSLSNGVAQPVAATQPHTEVLIQHWMMEARNLEDAAKQEDISDEEICLNKYLAEQLRRCIRDVEAMHGVAQPSWLPDVQFLLDRLEEFDPGDDEPEREFHGHVAPAISRLRSAISSTTRETTK
jgi:hypothetical protein